MIPSALLTIAGTISSLKLLDFFLSDEQKRLLDRWSLQLWIWLADAKERSLLDWLRRHRRLIVAIALVLGGLYFADFSSKMFSPFIAFQHVPSSLFILSILVATLFSGLWLGLTIINVTLRARSLFKAAGRASMFVLIAIAPLLIMLLFFSSDFLKPFAEAETRTTLGTLVLGSAIFFLYCGVFCSLIALIFWATVALPLVVIYALSASVFLAEFISRRVAEYPKGAILALSALLGGLAGLLKLFQPE